MGEVFTAAQQAWLDAVEHDRRTYTRQDTFAPDRCSCGHLVYADDMPGGGCRFCDCTGHESPRCPATGDGAP
jgi:hypothetical protein